MPAGEQGLCGPGVEVKGSAAGNLLPLVKGWLQNHLFRMNRQDLTGEGRTALRKLGGPEH